MYDVMFMISHFEERIADELQDFKAQARQALNPKP
jgi:hypothetical protein